MAACRRHSANGSSLPSEFGAKAARLFRERQIGDYEFDVSVTGPDAERDVAVASVMVEAIERLLS
jgi:3'-phosphoadenosine 5'-phosphosulfate sulfotransferase